LGSGQSAAAAQARRPFFCLTSKLLSRLQNISRRTIRCPSLPTGCKGIKKQIKIISSSPTASLLINLLQFLISSTCTSMDACLTFLLFSIRIDVDECVHPDAHSCYGICKNLPGSFQCQCPQGTYGDPTTKGGCITIKNSFPGDESSQYIQLYYCNHKV